MIDPVDDLAYHRRRAEQERRLAEAATDPTTRHVHAQLEQFHRAALSGAGMPRMVQPD